MPTFESLGLELIGAGEPVDRAVPPWLSRSRELLDDGVNATIAAIPQQAGVHPVSLARAFGKHLGSTPGEYQRRVRLSRLRDALGTRASLAAALDCGFSDQSQMTRAFSGAFGISPGRFRWFQNDKNLAIADRNLKP